VSREGDAVRQRIAMRLGYWFSGDAGRYMEPVLHLRVVSSGVESRPTGVHHGYDLHDEYTR
jgi:hypothetical protein